MIEKSYSATEPSPVSVEHIGGHTTVWLRKHIGGHTTVWLRKNIEQDTADRGPDESDAVTYWSCDEVSFTVPGRMTADQVESRFDELWAEHSGEDGDGLEQLQTIARLAMPSIDFASVTAADVVAISDYTPEWSTLIGQKLKQNSPCRYNGTIYRASQDVTVQGIYSPDVAGESLYYPITVAPDGIIVYRECHGDYDMVRKGELRHYPDADGPVYRALEDTAYSPDAYPAHWSEVPDGEVVLGD